MWCGGPRLRLQHPRSDVTQIPAAGTEDEETGVGEEGLGGPRELFTARNRKGHLDSPLIQHLGLPPQMQRDALKAGNWSR